MQAWPTAVAGQKQRFGQIFRSGRSCMASSALMTLRNALEEACRRDDSVIFATKPWSLDSDAAIGRSDSGALRPPEIAERSLQCFRGMGSTKGSSADALARRATRSIFCEPFPKARLALHGDTLGDRIEAHNLLQGERFVLQQRLRCSRDSARAIRIPPIGGT